MKIYIKSNTASRVQPESRYRYQKLLFHSRNKNIDCLMAIKIYYD